MADPARTKLGSDMSKPEGVIVMAQNESQAHLERAKQRDPQEIGASPISISNTLKMDAARMQIALHWPFFDTSERFRGTKRAV